VPMALRISSTVTGKPLSHGTKLAMCARMARVASFNGPRSACIRLIARISSVHLSSVVYVNPHSEYCTITLPSASAE
jgi:hypothetical protein